LGYNFFIEYKKGCENQGADSLSRALMSLTTINCDILSQLQEDLQHYEPKHDFSESKLHSGKLQQKNELWYWEGRLVIPETPSLTKRLLHEFHYSVIGGHGGYKKMLTRLTIQFYWKNMTSMTKEYVRSCTVCQQAKYNTQPPTGLLQPLPISSHIWQDISMDFITGLPLAHGCSVILVVVDRLSKFAHFNPLPADFTASKVAEAFLKNMINVHGIPQSIVSDRDKVFTSKFWEQCCGKQGIMLARSSAYHPETDDQTEVLNRCLEMYLRCFTQENPRDWYKLLSWVAYSYNTSFHSAIGMTPYRVVFGRDPPPLIHYEPDPEDILTLQEQLQQRDVVLEVLKANLNKAQLRMKARANSKRRELEFEVGQFVYVKLVNT